MTSRNQKYPVIIPSIILVLVVVLSTLKLVGFIDWNWFLITLPLTAPLIIVGGILSLLLIYALFSKN